MTSKIERSKGSSTLLEQIRRKTIAVPLAAIALVAAGCEIEGLKTTIEKDKPARVEGRGIDRVDVGNDQELIKQIEEYFAKKQSGAVVSPIPGGVPVGGGLFLSGGNSRPNYYLTVDQCELPQEAVHENCNDALIEVDRETFIEHPVGSYIVFPEDQWADNVMRDD